MRVSNMNRSVILDGVKIRKEVVKKIPQHNLITTMKESSI
ncbi:hypothetical protein SAMN04487910_1656 [Aquimarina amphilecti]|uniref:Uncharacterized protein n=1 Tax=Aquimarina amphilecti TaxID=1038014 RepID=A0A1H7MAK8_AQUAM|nr:hypothetical protein SAMN04487910_1656 [Aquimarina amphilecti]